MNCGLCFYGWTDMIDTFRDDKAWATKICKIMPQCWITFQFLFVLSVFFRALEALFVVKANVFKIKIDKVSNVNSTLDFEWILSLLHIFWPKMSFVSPLLLNLSNVCFYRWLFLSKEHISLSKLISEILKSFISWTISVKSKWLRIFSS